MTPERDLWAHYEPVHAIVYFDPAVSGCLAEVGLHGFWNGYFAGRAAPLGAVGPEPVSALFFGFSPAMVAKAVPKVWGRVSPADAVAARLAAVSRTLTPLIEQGSEADVRRVTDALTHAASSVPTAGRALAAAWQGVDPGTDLATRLWWAATVLREHRGDGHVAAATHAGLSGLETTMTHIASGTLSREVMQPNRGWTDEEWEAATELLVLRGLLTADGSLTPTGAEVRERLESDTDRMARSASGPLAADATLIRSVLGGLVRAIAATGSLPPDNPMGVPLPD
ncbi:MAG: SCO6745 family protein [Marmoricola sp.]